MYPSYLSIVKETEVSKAIPEVVGEIYQVGKVSKVVPKNQVKIR